MIGNRLHRKRGGRHTVGLVLVGVLGAGLVGCGSDAGESSSATDKPATTAASRRGQVFSDRGFRFNFTYPKDWYTGKADKDADQSTGGKPTARAAVGFDDDNGILMSRYDLSEYVTAAELPDHLSELDGIVSQFSGLRASGTVTDIGGLPAVGYEAFALPGDPAMRSSRIVFLFDDKIEYEINCQWTAKGRERVNQGCDQALATLRKQ